MTLPERKVILNTEDFVKKHMKGDRGSHDWAHIDRVRKLACSIAQAEGADPFIVELGALLHDIADHKFNDGDTEAGPLIATEWLRSLSLEEEKIARITTIIREVSFKGAAVNTSPDSDEGCIVQDADRLDAIGAIGIARAFSYGGFRNRPLYDPEEIPKFHDNFDSYQKSTVSTIGHFYEKLLLLKDLMNTDTGRAMAEERHDFMEAFIAQFMKEWNSES